MTGVSAKPLALSDALCPQLFARFAIDMTARVYLTCPAAFGEPGG